MTWHERELFILLSCQRLKTNAVEGIKVQADEKQTMQQRKKQSSETTECATSCQVSPISIVVDNFD